MSPDAALQKRALRRQLRDALPVLAPEARATLSRRAWDRLEAQAVWQRARTVFLFWPMDRELDTRLVIEAALREGRVVALPRFSPARGVYEPVQVSDPALDLIPGRLGILEPRDGCPEVELIRLDFVLVPGLGFGPDGRRLGRGKGFYDRMLARVGGWKCGVAFEQQIIDGIPLEPHDVCVDCLLTPARWQVVNPRPVLE